MVMAKDDVVELVRDRLWSPFNTERERLDRIDNWYRWEHDPPHQPSQSTKEYKALRDRAQTPWLNLVVSSVAQNLYVEGYRTGDGSATAPPWDWWQANGLDARQLPVHRAALAYGLSYVSCLPGEDPLTGADVPAIRGYSPRRMMAFYREPEHDEWPMYAVRRDTVTTRGEKRLLVRLYDEEVVHYLDADSMGTGFTYIEYRAHDQGVCPIVRFANSLDLEGRTPGEVEPLIPVAGRIDQTVFDRLVVQRFGSWIVRTIAGMDKPDAESDQIAEKLRLRIEDILIAEDADTKFGSLPATPLDGFIKAAEEDVRVLAAVSQTPVYELLGDLVNLSAEALEAARASLNAKVEERQHAFGESWEQVFRLAAWTDGDVESASDHAAQVRWRNTRTRSLAQAADALGKLATMLGVPPEVLWEDIPGWTQQDVGRARAVRDAAPPAPPTPPADGGE